jgi:hypothetical protein
MVQGRCMVSIESGKDDDSWSRDGCCEGGLLADHRSELGSHSSLVLVVERAELHREVGQLRHAVLLGDFAW